MYICQNFIVMYNIMEFIIRNADESDLNVMRKLFENTVRNINRRDYSPEQINAWIGKADFERWQELWDSDLSFMVAEVDNVELDNRVSDSEFSHSKEIVGFVSLNLSGYIHSLFVHYQYQRRGVASALWGAIKQFARINNIELLTSEVSITAKPFFSSRGFSVIEEQSVIIKGVTLINYLVELRLK